MKSSNSQQLGGLSIIDVPTWATDLVETLLDIVHPGCEPARVAIVPGDETVWIARSSNNLLGLDAAKLLSDRENALLASVQVGTDPAGLASLQPKCK